MHTLAIAVGQHIDIPGTRAATNLGARRSVSAKQQQQNRTSMLGHHATHVQSASGMAQVRPLEHVSALQGQRNEPESNKRACACSYSFEARRDGWRHSKITHRFRFSLANVAANVLIVSLHVPRVFFTYKPRVCVLSRRSRWRKAPSASRPNHSLRTQTYTHSQNYIIRTERLALGSRACTAVKRKRLGSCITFFSDETHG